MDYSFAGVEKRRKESQVFDKLEFISWGLKGIRRQLKYRGKSYIDSKKKGVSGTNNFRITVTHKGQGVEIR